MLRSVSVLAVAAVLVTGCTANSGQGKSGEATMSPAKGGSMVVAISSEPPSLNPMTSQVLPTWYVSNQILDTLVKYDSKFKPQPWLAKSWDISSDGKTYTFHLRDGVKWSDGKPFSAADVIYTFQEAGPKYSNTYGLIMSKLASLTSSGDEVTFTFSQPVGAFMSYLGDPNFSILPKHIYEGTDVANNPANMKPVGTGPFELKDWVQGDHLTLVRNPYFWDSSLPKLDRIEFKVVTNPATAIASLQSGAVQFVVSDIPPVNAKGLQNSSTVKLASPSVLARTLDVWFNLRKAPFNDLKVRQAVSLAVDRTRMVDNIAFGTTKAARSPLGSNSPYFDSTLPVLKRNLSKANKLLDEAGYPKKSDGTRFSFNLRVSTATDQFVKTAEIVKENLADVGIDVQVQAQENTTTLDAVFKNWDFDAAIYSMPLGPEPSLQLPAWLGQVGINHAYYSNAGGYDNPQVDALAEKAQETVDVTARTKIYDQVQKLIMADLPMVPLWEPTFISGYRSTVQNAFTAPDDRYLSFATTSLSK
ncbi:MAG TPA: ABC transporter substrate-binding protein [Lacisediminihabitans sp.]|uniref:ABC transporter substrate-binding protein n=1 Tax=Lacisediminihabitans sp. TaxID=2787631 RepID=UPI002ED7F697